MSKMILIDEATVKLALEALEDLGMKHFESTGEVLYKETFTAIKEALEEQPAQQEPVAWAETAMSLAADLSIESLRLGSYERKDTYENAGRASWQTVEIREKREAARERLRQHVYTPTPAQRTWVELTDEELDDIYQGAGKNDLRRAREVIAAFKERNT